MKYRKALTVALSTLAVAGCGKMGDLEPKAGQAMPAKAYGQTEAPGAEELSAPSVQTRPGRSDELMRRSERRRDDPFDLPPGETADGDSEEAAAAPSLLKPE